jgi:arylsulfatase A-like enzyme
VNDRPNILYLMSDQQKASATSIYGNTVVPCPFMEDMAAEGVAFKEAYTASSICTPSRTSVHTGVYPLVHQVTCHQNRAPYNLPQLAEILKEAGYYTAVIGHYEQKRNLTRGWHEQIAYMAPGPLYASARLKYSGGRPEYAWSSGAVPCTAEEGNSYLVATRAMRMLDEALKADGPFFLHVAFDDPHPPYFVPPPYDTLVDPADVHLPPQAVNGGQPKWQLRVHKEGKSEHASERDYRKTLAVYYGMIAYVNDQMRRIYDALAERGLLENTWIIIGSDHGDYAGEKGMWAKTESLYECLLHVPLILVPPKRSGGWGLMRGEFVSGLVNTLDLFPTILGLAGAPIPEYAQGYDLISWLESGAKDPLRDSVFAQVGDYHGFCKTTYPSGMPESGRHPGLLQGARSQEFSFVHDPDYGDEAYDLRNDPFELENLLQGYGKSVPSEVAMLREKVFEHEQECLRLRGELGVVPGDRGFVEGWE